VGGGWRCRACAARHLLAHGPCAAATTRVAPHVNATLATQDEGWKPSITVKQILLGIQVRGAEAAAHSACAAGNTVLAAPGRRAGAARPRLWASLCLLLTA
jgi:hypothetical protein